MSRHFQRELARLKDRLLLDAGRVENQLRKAVQAVQNLDGDLAREVIADDAAVDAAEVELEEECLKIVALYQPVARDLRLVVAVLKINNDLERIGDLAVNIAERAEYLSSRAPIWVDFDLEGMASMVISMVRESLDALVNLDPEVARSVCARDETIDNRNREVFHLIVEMAKQHPDQVDRLIPYMMVARHLERVADHATNIAEDVLYMIEGEIVRHRPDVWQEVY
ncbi:MAG: phosphate signaling complex protein PhoU [candidate division KSB1 bacterium]|nr:phosphate signaling complex protein PhoU [candidate division KSB1 bacterium]